MNLQGENYFRINGQFNRLYSVNACFKKKATPLRHLIVDELESEFNLNHSQALRYE